MENELTIMPSFGAGIKVDAPLEAKPEQEPQAYKGKRVKVFSLPWHIGHQYELLKLPFEWNYLIQHTRKWAESARPMPEHLNWVPYYEPGKYDFALLHVDQQCLDETISYGKTNVFKEMRKQINDIPIIVINHGTPVYPEVFMQMAEKYGWKSSEQAGEEWARGSMKKLLKGVSEMVVNSHEAQKQWAWGKAIIHGIDPDEWWNLPKEPRIVTCISPAGMGEKYYGRRFLKEVRDILRNDYGIQHMWIGENGQFAPSWDHYREYLGKSLIYFNPTIGSPMPRSRTEAMMSGCCVVTTSFQDADTFIKDGENGFIVPLNPERAAKILADLLSDYKRAEEIGQKGRETAMEIFSSERFRQDWKGLVGKILNRDL